MSVGAVAAAARSPTRWPRVLGLIVATALLAAVACSLIPDEEYLRYQLLDESAQAQVRWVYERTHFSDRPIDVAIIGASRTGAGIDAARLQRALTQAGDPVTVVNFSIPEEGRDLHWVLAEQILTRKHPRVLVVGVIEQPPRKGNPGFKFVAPAREIVDPGYVLNQDYLGHLAYLPYRQALLLLARLFPAGFAMHPRFDPRYAATGRHEFTGQHADLPLAELERRKRLFEGEARAPLLPETYAGLEFGDEQTYVRRIADLARRTGTRLVFLYMPYFGGPPTVVEPAIYRRYGRLLVAGFLAPHGDLYYNLAHLNHRGAGIATDWLAGQIAPLVHAPAAGSGPAGAFDDGRHGRVSGVTT